MTFIAGIYYIIFTKKAEIKVQAFRKSLKYYHLRAMWEKGYNSPFLRYLNHLSIILILIIKKL